MTFTMVTLLLHEMYVSWTMINNNNKEKTQTASWFTWSGLIGSPQVHTNQTPVWWWIGMFYFSWFLGNLQIILLIQYGLTYINNSQMNFLVSYNRQTSPCTRITVCTLWDTLKTIIIVASFLELPECQCWKSNMLGLVIVHFPPLLFYCTIFVFQGPHWLFSSVSDYPPPPATQE